MILSVSTNGSEVRETPFFNKHKSVGARFFGKNPFLLFLGKKGKGGHGSLDNRVQNERIQISSIWLIRFWWNFLEMFLVWNVLRLGSLVTCWPIFARACPSFIPKLAIFGPKIYCFQYISNLVDQIWKLIYYLLFVTCYCLLFIICGGVQLSWLVLPRKCIR